MVQMAVPKAYAPEQAYNSDVHCPLGSVGEKNKMKQIGYVVLRGGSHVGGTCRRPHRLSGLARTPRHIGASGLVSTHWLSTCTGRTPRDLPQAVCTQNCTYSQGQGDPSTDKCLAPGNRPVSSYSREQLAQKLPISGFMQVGQQSRGCGQEET